MNHLFRLIACILCVIFPLLGCESNVEDVALPTVKISAGETTATSISFTVTATDATECAYMLFDGGELKAVRILNDGVKIAGDGTVTTVEGLTPDTQYLVVAAAGNSRGTALTPVTSIKTTKSDGGTPDDNPNDNPNDNTDTPLDPDARHLEIEKTTDGRWYADDNYYVTLVATTGERIILDFYTVTETLSSYLPYGTYFVNDTNGSFTIGEDSSGIILHPDQSAEEGYTLAKDSFVSVDVQNGYYAIYFHLTYYVNDTPNLIDGFYNGPLSGAAVPEGDNAGAKKLIEVLNVGSTEFSFRINAEAGQYWRCSVVDKRTYDQVASNPGAWVVTYGFMLDGTRTFNWKNGEQCEHVPGLDISVTSSTDYLILAALMDYSEGQENVLAGGVEVEQIRTEAEAAGTATATINIKEVNANDILFDCTFGDDVWCCYVAMMETTRIEEIKAGEYALFYDSFEECMLSLIPGLSHDFMRQFIEPTMDYRWEYLKYNTSYTMCVKVVDMNNAASYIELESFTTL